MTRRCSAKYGPAQVRPTLMALGELQNLCKSECLCSGIKPSLSVSGYAPTLCCSPRQPPSCGPTIIVCFQALVAGCVCISRLPQVVACTVSVDQSDRGCNEQVEITCEHNLFLYYVHEIDQTEFTLVKDIQKLTCDWGGYAAVLLRLLSLSSKQPNYFAIFIKQSATTSGRLWFIQVRCKTSCQIAFLSNLLREDWGHAASSLTR